MLEHEFADFLASCPEIKSPKAISTRLSKGRAVEKRYSVSLDDITGSDKAMRAYLERINSDFNNQNGGYSNAVRKYYTFKTGKVFPKL